MRSHFVVFPTPVFDLFLGILEAEEPVLAEAFHADDGIEALSVGIVRRLARAADVQDDAVRVCPEIEFLRGELAALVDADRRRVALMTTLARLGVGVARLSPRAAMVGLRSAALRFDGMIAMRSATVDRFVARRFAELAAQGHGPQCHEGAVTRQMLIDRVLLGIDPMTGTRMDGVRTGRLHIVPGTASRITSEADYVAAESYIRRTVEFRDARDFARTLVGVERPRFEVILPIEEVMGPDFAASVEGVRRLGSVRNPQGIQPVDFSNGKPAGQHREESAGESGRGFR